MPKSVHASLLKYMTSPNLSVTYVSCLDVMLSPFSDWAVIKSGKAPFIWIGWLTAAFMPVVDLIRSLGVRLSRLIISTPTKQLWQPVSARARWDMLTVSCG